MTVSVPDYEQRFAAAVREFWSTRDRQAADQLLRGVSDTGSRSAVTGGQHLDAIATLTRQIFHDAGLNSPASSSVLPGYYRYAKNWDVVVTYKGRLVAIIELKSHVGSFGNNQNNRIEEMIGQSRDIWLAARESLLGDIRPWFGYLMLLEDHPNSRRPPGGGRRPLLPADPIFQDTSYLDRYKIAFERLRLEGDVNAACLLVSERTAATVEYPDPTMSFNAFAAAIHGRVTEIVGMLGL
jgi:hypothetical protein